MLPYITQHNIMISTLLLPFSATVLSFPLVSETLTSILLYTTKLLILYAHPITSDLIAKN